jgi:tRNA nucleotidyltransferase (CCA-adding enzyme)
MGSIAKIESNPEQSKHLETAKQEIMGLDIDYVNLRKEGYTEGSRIPSAMVCPSGRIWGRGER